jgi:predicted ribosomally synthesized peptide with nif11-like leader
MNPSFEQLLNKVSENPDLREKFKQANGIDDIIAIAKDLGCSIEASDLIQYQKQNSATLSDAELESVAGGAGGGCFADAQTMPTTMYATKNCY